MRRHKHSLSHYHLTTMDMGQLVPVGCLEVLPGDTFQHQVSSLIRVTPQLKPLMHPVQVRLHHFYVPTRLLWSGWEDFITGKNDTDLPPTINGQAYSSGTLQDYLGVYDDEQNDYLAMPIRAYNMIFNEYYRDQDLTDEVDLDSLDVQRISWAKDYFTAARPWPQKGDPVTIPIGDSAPIVGTASITNPAITSTFRKNNGNLVVNAASTSNAELTQQGAVSGSQVTIQSTLGNPAINTSGLSADLSAASALDIRDFREAFALQRYQEARARYGSRYTEYLRYIGVRPSDARLQRPEYLGGGRQTISFSEVLNVAGGTENEALGAFGGHGIAALRSNRYRRFFEEHGYVITLMSVRPRSIYCNGLNRKFSRQTKEDYYQKELEMIGQQEIRNKEIYAAHSNPEDVFGYTDRYREYKEEPSRVSGQFATSIDYDWHLGRIFNSDVALNESFITCDPTKRVFAEQTQHSLYVMVNHSIQARRMIPKNPASRII